MNDFSKEPISCIEWRDSATLNGNDYNPNVVFNPELRLLEKSILMTGWVQPVLIATDGTIIDGFHRAMLSRESKALRERYHGKVPCAVLDVTRAEAMLLTIRMNRAKGTHVAVRMSEIVRELVDVHHVSPEQVAAEIGATPEEITLLRQDGVFKMKNIDKYAYSKAWYPAEVKKVAKA
jgi:ParB-like chromosome segregation protein Spo0J